MKTLKLKFICAICSQELGWFEPEKMSVPLNGTMFERLNEGYPTPFHPAVEWEHMKCLVCRYRPFIAENQIETPLGTYTVGESWRHLDPNPGTKMDLLHEEYTPETPVAKTLPAWKMLAGGEFVYKGKHYIIRSFAKTPNNHDLVCGIEKEGTRMLRVGPDKIEYLGSTVGG